MLSDIYSRINLLEILFPNGIHFTFFVFTLSSDFFGDPIRLLVSFMDDHKLKPKDLVDLLKVSKGYISEILHYKKGLSKEVTRKLPDHFKVAQEAFNRPYELVSLINSHLKNARVF
jgi:hypothetical protein